MLHFEVELEVAYELSSRLHYIIYISISYITSVKDVSNLKLRGREAPKGLNWIHPSHEGYKLFVSYLWV